MRSSKSRSNPSRGSRAASVALYRRPVRGVKIRGGFDFVNTDNQFQNLVTDTVKTNRNGNALLQYELNVDQEPASQFLDAIFWSFAALPTNGKKIGLFSAECFVAEVTDRADFDYFERLGLDQDRFALIFVKNVFVLDTFTGD